MGWSDVGGGAGRWRHILHTRAAALNQVQWVACFWESEQTDSGSLSKGGNKNQAVSTSLWIQGRLGSALWVKMEYYSRKETKVWS